MDLRRRLVLSVASSRRVDVHSIHPQSVCDLARPLCRCHTSSQLPQHHESEASEGSDWRTVGAVFRDMLPSVSWVERQTGKE